MADRIKNYQQEADQITTLKAIRTDLGVTPSSYTPDATVVTKDRVVTFAQAEEELVVLSDIEKGVKQQIVDVDIAQKDITNIKALLQGHLYDYQTDSTSAYIKSVPSGAMPYAGLEKIGGKTVVWNQLEPNPTTVYTSNNTHALVSGTRFIAGHKYYMHCEYSGTVGTYTGTAVYVRLNGANRTIVNAANNSSFSVIQTSAYDATSNGGTNSTEGNCWVYVYLDGADSITNIQIVDLTLMFGAGNEPSTPADYEAIFPSINAYNAGTLLSAGVTEVVSKDSNNATLQTIPIHTAIRNLEGYGWSAGSVSNYIDFERKVFVKCVDKIVLNGTQEILSYNWRAQTNSVGWGYSHSVANVKVPTGNGVKANVLSAEAPTITYDAAFLTDTYGIAVSAVSPTYSFFVRSTDTSLTTTTAINNYLSANPMTVYYELATPVEVDISEYLTDDNLIQVESGGTLTFPNSNGTDYQIPVPSEETYMIDLQEAINNG